MSKAFTDGNDPFEQFVSDGIAAIDACLERGVAFNGKIAGYGVSAPPTASCDYPPPTRASTPWPGRARHRLGRPPEFADHADPQRTADLHIENWADQLADKAVYLCIGSQDDVVSTESCVRFAMKLFEVQRSILPEGALLNRLHVVNTPSHSPGQYWRLDATQYLLDVCAQRS